MPGGGQVVGKHFFHGAIKHHHREIKALAVAIAAAHLKMIQGNQRRGAAVHFAQQFQAFAQRRGLFRIEPAAPDIFQRLCSAAYGPFKLVIFPIFMKFKNIKQQPFFPLIGQFIDYTLQPFYGRGMVARAIKLYGRPFIHIAKNLIGVA